jgi:Ni,Fe-hydrogenase maturation factor
MIGLSAIQKLLGLTFLGKLPEIYLFVVSVAELQPMYIGLSPEVEVALGRVKEKILERIKQLRKNERM